MVRWLLAAVPWHGSPSGWPAELVVLAGLAVPAGLYLWAFVSIGSPAPPRWYAAAFLTGLAALGAALTGPIEQYADDLFTVHMLQHLLLTLVAPPLLWLGRPVAVGLRALPPARRRALLGATIGRAWVRRLLSILTHPLTVVGLFNGTLLAWHLPGPYVAAVRSTPLHLFEHATFVGTALLFWWVLIDPRPVRQRLSTSAALLVLFATWMANDLLGILITLAPEPLYLHYSVTRNPWGLTPATDQWLGGLVMWIGCGVLFAALMVGRLVAPYWRRPPVAGGRGPGAGVGHVSPSLITGEPSPGPASVAAATPVDL